MVACGSSASPTADYLDRAAAITTKMTSDTQASTPRNVVPSHLQVAVIEGLRTTALKALQALDPSDDVRPEHLALVDALSRLVGAGQAFVDDTAGLDQAAFEAALNASTDINGLVTEVHAACAAMERRAAELDHPVSMGC